MRNSPANIETRREKVKLLLSLGFNHSEIARQLVVSRRTILYDIKAIKAGWRAQYEKIDLKELVGEILHELNQRRQQLYKIFQAEGQKDYMKLRALKQLGDEQERMVNILQSLGVVYKEPDKLNAEINYVIKSAVPRHYKNGENNQENADS